MINKKVMALAVAGALAAPAAAFAQASNVQIYGTFDVSVNYIDHSGFNTFAATPVSSPGVQKFDVYNQSSRIGFKGVEDLGNGLKAWFQAESNIAADGRQFNNTAGQGSRNTAVGLEGNFGNVLMGNWDSPYKSAEGIWNISSVGGYVGFQNLIMHGNDSTGSNPNLACNNVNVAASAATGAPICPQLEATSTSFSNRMSNTIQYWSPVFSGVQIKFAMRANEEKVEASTGTAKNNPGSWATTANWTGGNFGATFGYEKHIGWRDVGITSAGVAPTASLTTPNNVQDTAWTLGGNYNFGVVQIAGAMEMMKFGNAAVAGAENNFDRKNYILGAAAPIGNGTLRAGYTWTPGPSGCGAGLKGATAATAFLACDGNTKAQAFQLGYEHNLSKRTQVYGAYTRLDNGTNTTYNFSTPVLNQTGAVAGTGAGQDVTVWGAGIRHSF